LKTKILNLIDFEKVDTLLEGFNKSTGFVTAILDLDGNVLSKSGWRQVCTEFHRIHPETSKRCTISDTILAGQMAADEKYHFYKCLNGLVDVAVPIVIKGEHIANLFSGQFFFEKPDEAFFKEQAKKYGFDEDSYIKALEKVPVVSEERVKAAMEFLQNMTQLISEMTFQKLEQIVLNEELKASEERYRLISDVVSDYIFTSKVDNNGKLGLSWVTGAFEGITGYSFDEYIARGGWRAALHPDDIEKDNQDFEELKKNNQVISDVRTLAKNGRIVWVRVSAHPVWDYQNNELVGIYGGVKDVTESKLAENALANSEARLHTLVQTIPDLIWLKDINGVYLSCNAVFERFYGAKEADIIGKTDYDFINSELADFFRENDLKAIEVGKPSINEEWITFADDGHTALLETTKTPMYNSSGTLIGVLGIGHDITERKLADETIRRNEHILRLFVEHSPASICMFDREMKYIVASKRYLRDYDLGEQDIRGRSHYEIFPDVPEKWKEIHQCCMAGAIEKSEEDSFPRASGKLDWVRWEIHPWYEQNDEIGGIILFSEVITERKHAEEEIKKLNAELEFKVELRTAQLEASNKELEAFSYSVSHDLRAPLRHINGYVNLLNERYSDDLPEKARHYLETVTGAAKQMGMLIDDLLQFSRTGRQEIQKTTIDMNVLIKEVLEKIKPDTENREINWSVQELPEVFGDYSLLKQVWLNLLDNAIKYTRNKKLAEISIGCTVNQENIVFFVRDNGVGFDMKYAHKLFGVFQRLHTQAEFEGTGIGLANVQRIIFKHSGQVWAEAKPDLGATFFFSLPKK